KSLRDLPNDDELSAALRRASRRILSWRIPPNWSAHDWFDEVEAITAAACCYAEIDYDLDLGVPLSAFVYQRALTCARTRYRQNGRTLSALCRTRAKFDVTKLRRLAPACRKFVHRMTHCVSQPDMTSRIRR